MRLASLADRKARIKKSIAIFRKLNPNPKCELYYETPYQLLVSVVLSAQATDKSVNACMEPLYKKKFGPTDVLKLGQKGLLEKIRTIGLAPTKSKNIYNLTKILCEKYNGEVPNQRNALEALPGVGRKTANVILGELFGEPTIAVDTHVFRVSQRLGLHKETTPEKCEKVLLNLIPAKDLPAAHHWLILHGRYCCKARKPECEKCQVSHLCPSKDLLN